MFWVAAAGPISNLMMAALWALLIKFSVLVPTSYSQPMALMGAIGVMMNTVLMVLNLLPLPPLDGGRIAVSLLPMHLAIKFAKIEPYGFVILLALLFTEKLSIVMNPFIVLTLSIIDMIFL